MLTVTVEHRFTATHYIPGHPVCGNLHEHEWKLITTVARKPGYMRLENGMVWDFKEIAKLLADIPCPRVLNDLVAIPTCENLLDGWFVPNMQDILPDALELISMRLWENEKYSCEWTMPGGWTR